MAPASDKSLLRAVSSNEYGGHKKKVHSVAWSCTGAKLASGSVDQMVKVFTVDNVACTSDIELRGHTDSVDQLRWDPKHAELLGTASGDKTVRIWDCRTGKCAQAIETRGENINIRWSPDGAHIAVGDKEDNLSIIEMRKCKTLQSTHFNFEVNEIAWEHTGKLFFLTTGAGNIEVISYAELLAKGEAAARTTIHAHTANVYCIDFNQTGEYFALGSADSLVSLWDVRELACIRTFTRLEGPVRQTNHQQAGGQVAAGVRATIGPQLTTDCTRCAHDPLDSSPRDLRRCARSASRTTRRTSRRARRTPSSTSPPSPPASTRTRSTSTPL